MRKFLLLVCILFLPVTAFGVDVMPKVVGNAATDSIIISFGTMDTTYYPVVANADSLVILVYPPDNATPDSAADGDATVLNPTTGYYEYHRLGKNGDSDLGIYRVAVKAWKGGAIRGIGTTTYLVTGTGTYHYAVIDTIRDKVLTLPTDTWNKDISGYAGNGGSNYAGYRLKIISDNFDQWTAAEQGSVLVAITDVNKANFKATGFATSTQGDSLTNAITATNKANFKATDVNVTQISGDATAADNFETMLDGTGGEDLTLGRLRIYASGNETAFVAVGAGSGHGFFTQGGATGHGLFSLGGATGHGILGVGGGTSGDGLRATATTNGYGIFTVGAGDAKAGLGVGGGSGAGASGIDIVASTNTGAGIKITTTDGNGINIVRGGSNYDINLGGDGTIHGSIDSCAGPAYVGAVMDTINAHAPHGDNWATAGSGDTSEVKAMMQNNWDSDTDGELSVETSTGADSTVMKTMIQNNWDSDTDGEFSVEAGAGGADTTQIKTMMQRNWDSDTDGKLSVQDSVIFDISSGWPLIAGIKAKTDSASFAAAGLIKSTPQTDVTVSAASVISIAANCSTYNQAMIQRNWDTDDDALLSVENPADSVTIDLSNTWPLITSNFIFDNDSLIVDQSTMRWDLATGGSDTSTIKTMLQNNWDSDTDGLLSVEDSLIIDLSHAWLLRGEAAGLDTTQIKTMIANNWDTDDDAQLAAEISGTGIYAVNIDIKKTTDSSVVPQYHVAVYDSTTDAFINEQTTNTSGRTSWSLDAGTYAVQGNLAGWEDLTTEYLTVSANVTDTYYVAQTALGASDPTRCNCYCYTYDLTTYKSGCKLTAKIPKMYGRVTTSSVVITPFEVSATSDDTGYVNLELPRSSEMTSSTGSTVKILLQLIDPAGNEIADYDTLLEIPDSTSHKIW